MASVLLTVGEFWSCVWRYYDQAVICASTLLLALTDFISINSDGITVEIGNDKE